MWHTGSYSRTGVVTYDSSHVVRYVDQQERTGRRIAALQRDI